MDYKLIQKTKILTPHTFLFNFNDNNTTKLIHQKYLIYNNTSITKNI